MIDPLSLSDPAARAAFAAAGESFRRQGRAFQAGAYFLPREKRLAAAAVFAFCSMIRELIDVEDAEAATSSCSPTSLDGRIEIFHSRLEEIYTGKLDLPDAAERTTRQHILSAIATVIARYEIPRPYFVDFAEGRRMEITLKRYPTWNRLQKYLDLSCGSVGRMMCAVLGVQNSDAAGFASRYAEAMRLTAILLSIPQDFGRMRIFLPLEDLAGFGYSERDLAANAVNDAFRELMKFQIARARDLYRQGAEGLCWLAEDGSRLAAALLGTTWSASLSAIEAADYDVLAKRPRVPLARKAMRLPAAWKLAKRFAGEPLPDVF